jgi:hypothetical protein
MNLYRVVTTTVTEYVVRAETAGQAELHIRCATDAVDSMTISESVSAWSEPVRIVGTEYAG